MIHSPIEKAITEVKCFGNILLSYYSIYKLFDEGWKELYSLKLTLQMATSSEMIVAFISGRQLG